MSEPKFAFSPPPFSRRALLATGAALAIPTAAHGAPIHSTNEAHIVDILGFHSCGFDCGNPPLRSKARHDVSRCDDGGLLWKDPFNEGQMNFFVQFRAAIINDHDTIVGVEAVANS